MAAIAVVLLVTNIATLFLLLRVLMDRDEPEPELEPREFYVPKPTTEDRLASLPVPVVEDPGPLAIRRIPHEPSLGELERDRPAEVARIDRELAKRGIE